MSRMAIPRHWVSSHENCWFGGLLSRKNLHELHLFPASATTVGVSKSGLLFFNHWNNCTDLPMRIFQDVRHTENIYICTGVTPMMMMTAAVAFSEESRSFITATSMLTNTSSNAPKLWSHQSLLLIDPICILLAFPVLNWSPELWSDLSSGWDLGVPLVASFPGEIREETSLCFLRNGSPLELDLELSLEESTSLSLLLNSHPLLKFQIFTHVSTWGYNHNCVTMCSIPKKVRPEMTRLSYHQSFSCLFGEWDQFDRRISTATAPWTRLKDCTMILAFIASFILGSFGKTRAFGIISIQTGMILVIKGMRGSLRRPSLNFSHFQHQIRLDTRRVSNQTPFRRPQKYEK